MASQKYGYMATIGADTSGLTSALQTMDAEAKKVSAELRETNNNLKFEDGGTVALQQKYELLQQAIEQTRQKLETLRNAEEKVNAAAESGKISEANQRLFQRELDSTANKLARYQKEAEETNRVLQDLANGQQTANDAMQTSEEIADIVSKAMQRYTSSAKNTAASNEEERSSFEQVEKSAEKAAAALEKVTLKNNIGFDKSAIEYIENYGKETEKAVSAYEKYKLSVGETNDFIKQTEAEYNKLNKLLESNADNQTLAAQKNEIKNQLIEAETYKLDKLNQQYNDMKHSFDSGDIGAEQFREFQREVELTKIKLDELQKSEEDSTDTVKDLDKALDNAGKTTVTFGDIVKANFLGDLIADGFRKAGSAVGDFIQQGITLASDLTEVQNVVDVTFGDGAAQIYEWSDAAAESFGMSSLAAQQYNGTMGAMLKSMGLTDDKVKEMSMDMTGLAGDMASFYNLDVEKAFEKIRSGISGETEPLKQLSINMSVANLEAYALSQGIETAYKKMTEAEKATLRYNYLMSVTADAQGDFARTSDSFANQQRILELQTQNLAASFGEKLLPKINDLTGTLNENMPSIGENIDGVGDIVVGLFDFIIDHHQAILSVITGIGTAIAAQKAGKVIGDVTGAVKNLFNTVKSGEGVMSALAGSLNTQPWVLAAGAIAAVTVGLITYANSVDSVGNSIKNVNKNIEELQKNTEETIADTETEIAVLRDKAARYEELLSIEKRTAGQEEELAHLAGELQQYMPEGTQLIDEQTGAYNSLAGSIDSVAEAMRRKATIAAYEDEYTGLIKQQLEAQKNLEDAQKEYDDYFNNRKAGFGISFESGGNNKALALKKQLTDAETTVDNIDNQLDELDSKINALYEQEPKQQISAGETYADYMQRIGQEQLEEDKRLRAEDLADYENNLKAKKEELDNSLALRQMSEEEYYQEIGKYLSENKNLSSKEYFKLLGEYEAYLEKKQKAADKAAEDEEKAEKARQDAVTKAQKKAETERVNAIKASWDKITRMKDRGEIDEEAEYKLKAQLVKKYCDENEDTWDSYYKWLYDYSSKKEKEIADAKKKAWEDSTKELKSTLEKSYEDIKKQKEQVKKDLQGIDLTETVKDKDGNDVLVLTDLDAEIKKIDDYEASLEKLKKSGISDSLMNEIMKKSYASGDRQAFIDQLLGLSPEKLQLYYDDWERYQTRLEESADNAVADKLEETNQAAADGVKDIFKNIPSEAYAEGVETARQYLQGIIDSMGDVDAAAALRLGNIADRAAVQNNPNLSSTEKLLVSGKLIPASTPINIILDSKKYVETTIGNLISKGQISGGNVFNL